MPAEVVQIFYPNSSESGGTCGGSCPVPIEHFYNRTQTCLIVHAKSEAFVAGEHEMVTVAQVQAGDRICCLICSSLPALSLQAEFEIRPSSVFSFCLNALIMFFPCPLCTAGVCCCAYYLCLSGERAREI